MRTTTTLRKFTYGQRVKTAAGVVCLIHGYVTESLVLLQTKPESGTWQAIAPEYSLTAIGE